jgi:hypothetical protein
MSLNKFTESTTKKEWMKINCKECIADEIEAGNHLDVVTASVDAPPAGSERLYNNGVGLFVISSNGDSKKIALVEGDSIAVNSTYFSQVQQQNTPGSTTYGAALSLLNSSSVGKGSLTIPANDLANDAAYELNVSGLINIVTNPKKITFGIFVDGVLHRECLISVADLPIGANESYVCRFYLSCRDVGGGDVVLYPSGDVTISSGNSEVIPMTGVGAYNTPIPTNVSHVIDLKAILSTTDAGDELQTEYATLKRLA